MIELAAILKNASELLPKAWGLAKSMYQFVGDKASYDFRLAHQAYCTAVVTQYCRARTFFVRDEPQFLEDFYVPASIVRGKKRVPHAGLDDLARVARRVIVTGSGGAGKTIFMRHLLLDAIQSGQKYPVFIELRRLNDLDDLNLEDVIAKLMEEHGFPLGRDFAVQSLHDGLLVVLLDGFDEVLADKRNRVEREIRRIATKSASQFVLSSRQDSLLEGWDNFSTVAIAPLELEEACELVSKIPFNGEGDIKKRFVRRLREGLFASHEYFLSNPLLLSIMLLTYGDSADIPSKFSSFYDQAFSALFQKHDALKSGFKRDRNVSLDILDFGRLFSAFSAVTYDKRALRFSLADGIRFVDYAKRLSGLPIVSSEGFIEDARQAVCLLIEDGLEYSFVHRSFQEYFAAKFVSEANSDTQDKFVKKLIDEATSYQSDNVLQLLYELNPTLVEERYLIPELRGFFGTTRKKKLTRSVWKKLYGKLFVSLHLGEDSAVGYKVRSRKIFHAILFVKRNCYIQKEPLTFSMENDLSSQAKAYVTGGVGDLQIKDIPERSSVWDSIDGQTIAFSFADAENLRLAIVELEERARQRSNTVREVFSFD